MSEILIRLKNQQELARILDALWSYASMLRRGQPFEQAVAQDFDDLANRLHSETGKSR